jgi:hypothetical protein
VIGVEAGNADRRIVAMLSARGANSNGEDPKVLAG